MPAPEDVDLREHLERLMQLYYDRLAEQVAALRDYVDARLIAVQREADVVTRTRTDAIRKQEDSTDKRFDSVNEFRAQLTKQAADFMPREVADNQIAELRRALTELTEKISKLA